MKKLLLLLLFLLFVNCRNNNTLYEYKLTYKVYYSSNVVKTYNITNNEGYFWDSDRGSNYIKEGNITGNNIINTSAPIEIISYTKEEIIKENN